MVLEPIQYLAENPNLMSKHFKFQTQEGKVRKTALGIPGSNFLFYKLRFDELGALLFVLRVRLWLENFAIIP